LAIPRHATVSPLKRIRFVPSTFAKRFPDGLHTTVPLGNVFTSHFPIETGAEATTLGTPYGVSRRRFAAPNAAFRAGGAWDLRQSLCL